MSKSALLLTCLLTGMFISGCQRLKPAGEKVTIATAANMQFAMEELVEVYTKRGSQEIELIVGSSGKLTAQISQGAPYDLLVAANMIYPREVERRGRAGSVPRVYARGTLVLWSANENMQPSISLLGSDSIRHIAIANPRLAPYGKAAIEVLARYGVLEAIEHKLVYGESIAQANQFVLSGAAEMGFTSLSMVVSPHLKEIGNWVQLDTTLYSPIEQGVVLIKGAGEVKKGARDFYDFLFTEEAREVLKKFGYSVSE